MPLFVIALFGLLLGSFINLCVHRLPEHISIVRPRSRCPNCGHQITAWENIPVLSYVFLRGRCSECRTKISPRYPITELLVAAAFVLCYWIYGPSIAFLKFAFFSVSLVLLVLTDHDVQQLPDEVTLSGVVVGFVATAWVPLPGAPSGSSAFLAALAGAAFGAGLLWLVGELYLRIRGREGMGLGDVKMMGMVGAFLGLKLTFVTIFLATICGALVGTCLGLFVFVRRLARWRRKGQSWSSAWPRAKSSAGAFFTRLAIPFGVFLGIMAIVSWLWGLRLWDWYLGQFGPKS